MAKANTASPLVVAAAAVDEELRSYAELARDVKRITLDSEKALARAAKLLEESSQRQGRIQEKLRTLVAEIEKSRATQAESLDLIVEVAKELEARAGGFDTMMKRFAALGEAAKIINALTSELSAKKNAGAAEAEILDGMRALEEAMVKVVVDAEDLARDAQNDGWSEIARQADAVRQQVRAAKNRLSLAHRSMAERAPS